MDSLADPSQDNENLEIKDNSNPNCVKEEDQESTSNLPKESVKTEDDVDKHDDPVVPDIICTEQNTSSDANDCTDDDASTDDLFAKADFTKKRFSVDYKKRRIDFKRFSIDCSRNVATLEELANLEKELARTNVDVRIGRRKSTGILKSTSDSGDIGDSRLKIKQDSCSDDDEVFEREMVLSDTEGPREPPATPVGRDELALRRHRFFSDLVCAARAAVEHRVRFDPLGPVIADGGKDIFYSHRYCS
ncbi:unnamed protein product, partial [Brenthis ino]